MCENKLRDLIGFADQEKITSGSDYSLTLKRNNNDIAAIFRGNGVDGAKIDVRDIGWYFSNFTPSMEHQQMA